MPDLPSRRSSSGRQRQQDALREVARAAAKLARSADIKSRSPESSGGHSVYEDARRLDAALTAWDESR